MRPTNISLGIALIAVITVGAAEWQRQSTSIGVVNTQQQYPEDACVPQHSGVLSLAVQRVNHIVNPECETY